MSNCNNYAIKWLITPRDGGIFKLLIQSFHRQRRKKLGNLEMLHRLDHICGAEKNDMGNLPKCFIDWTR